MSVIDAAASTAQTWHARHAVTEHRQAAGAGDENHDKPAGEYANDGAERLLNALAARLARQTVARWRDTAGTETAQAIGVEDVDQLAIDADQPAVAQ